MNGRSFVSWVLPALFSALLLVGCSGGDTPTAADVEETADEGTTAAELEVSTFAGQYGTPGLVDGTGTAARFNCPSAMIYDGGSTLYVAEYNQGLIRTVDINTAAVGTLASGLNGPSFLALDGSSLYVSSSPSSTICEVDTGSGIWSTVAGLSAYDPDFDYEVKYVDDFGLDAVFNGPMGLTVTGGYLYICDCCNHVIRRMDLVTTEVTTVAGEAGSSGYRDGVGLNARFDSPYGLTTDGSYLYVADYYNSAVRQVNLSTMEVTTLTGGRMGHIDGSLAEARFSLPLGISLDSGGDLLVTDFWDNCIRYVGDDSVSTLVGAKDKLGYLDGTASQAWVALPKAAVDTPAGIFFTDNANRVIRKID